MKNFILLVYRRINSSQASEFCRFSAQTLNNTTGSRRRTSLSGRDLSDNIEAIIHRFLFKKNKISEYLTTEQFNEITSFLPGKIAVALLFV
jgi:hypothetical protein